MACNTEAFVDSEPAHERGRDLFRAEPGLLLAEVHRSANACAFATDDERDAFIAGYVSARTIKEDYERERTRERGAR